VRVSVRERKSGRRRECAREIESVREGKRDCKRERERVQER
jgi:hypothetical protein